MSHRISQVNEVIRQELNTVLLTEVDLPKNCLLTIIRVEASKDLRHARVWFSVMPTYYIPKVLEKLNKNKKHLEYMLHQRLEMKPLPKLSFKIDETERKAAEIEELLDSIKENG